MQCITAIHNTLSKVKETANLFNVSDDL